MYVQYGNVYVWFCDKWNTLVQKFVKWDKMSAKNHLPYIWTYVYNIVMSIWSSVKKYQMRQNFSQAKSTLYMNTCVQYGLVYVLLCKRLADIIHYFWMYVYLLLFCCCKFWGIFSQYNFFSVLRPPWVNLYI